MTDRRIVDVEILSRSVYGSLIDPDRYASDTILSVVEWLQRTLENVPPEFRESAYFEIESEGGYEGEHYATLRIYYKRPETDAEVETRVQKAKDRAERWIQKREEQQRRIRCGRRAWRCF